MQHFRLISCLILFLAIPAHAQDLGVDPIAPIVPALPQEGGPAPSQGAEISGGEEGIMPQQNNQDVQQNAAQDQKGPVCGQIKNQSGHKIFGSIMTDVAGERDGVSARHRATIRLEDGEAMDVCSEGPFFEGQRLELTLRSLFPLFSCKTRIAGQTITIKSEPREEGGLRFFANCI